MITPRTLPYDIEFTDGKRTTVNIDNSFDVPLFDCALMMQAIYLAEAAGATVRYIAQPGHPSSVCNRAFVVGRIKQRGESFRLTEKDRDSV